MEHKRRVEAGEKGRKEKEREKIRLEETLFLQPDAFSLGP